MCGIVAELDFSTTPLSSFSPFRNHGYHPIRFHQAQVHACISQVCPIVPSWGTVLNFQHLAIQSYNALDLHPLGRFLFRILCY